MNLQLLFILIMIAQFIVIIFLIVLNVKLNKKNKKTTNIIKTYKARLREDELDEAIHNEHFIMDKSVRDWKNVAYETEFTDEDKVRISDSICVHLECEGRLAKRKYLINIKDELYLGKDKTNGVVLEEPDIDKKHVHFVRQGNEMYIQNLSTNFPVLLVRNKSKYGLTDVLVKINDGDTLEFKESKVLINLI